MNELDDNNLNRFLTSGDGVPEQATGTDLEGNPLLPTPGETIDSPWGQSVVDRVVPRYSSEAVRDASILTPDEGQLCYILELDEFQIWDGLEWIVVGSAEFLPLTGGTMTGNLTLRKVDPTERVVIDVERTIGGNESRLRIQIAAAGDVEGYARFSRLLNAVSDADVLLGNNEFIAENTSVIVERAGTATQINMINTLATHHWRYRILTTNGSLQLMSAPIGTTDWTAVESWTPAAE